jgi:hypothetical protein
MLSPETKTVFLTGCMLISFTWKILQGGLSYIKKCVNKVGVILAGQFLDEARQAPAEDVDGMDLLQCWTALRHKHMESNGQLHRDATAGC